MKCEGRIFIATSTELTVSRAVHFANAAGANAVTKVGPMEGAATRDELDALLGQSEG